MNNYPEVLIYMNKVKDYILNNKNAKDFILSNCDNEDIFFYEMEKISIHNFTKYGDPELSRKQLDELRLKFKKKDELFKNITIFNYYLN